jgi:C4-dicarboxylate transporter, DctQ subunit
MTTSSVRSDSSLLSRIDRAFNRLEAPLALISGMAILAMMFLSVANVLGRKIFNLPVPGYIDLMQQAVPVAAFLGIALVQRNGGHIRMDLLIGKVRGRRLWLVEFLSILFILIVVLALIYGSWDHFARSYTNGDSSMDIGLPLWPAKFLVPFALSLLAVRLCLQLWAYGRAFARGDQYPVAVPLIEDAAAQAAHEAEHVSGADA